MVEVTICTFLVGMLGVSSMHATGNVFRTWVATASTHSRIGLAQSLLAEIAQSPYADEGLTVLFGPELGETSLIPNTRSGFDDVDDYHNWSESPPKPKSSSTGLSGYAGWSRSVSVEWAEPANPSSNAFSDKGLKRVTVTVTDPAGKVTRHVAYYSRWGAVQRPLAADVTVRTYAAIELQIGNGSPTFNGVNITNHAQDR